MWKPTTRKSYWTPQPTSDELYHHGILGQRWGKKNGPPYPLDAEDHSAAEKKAGYKKSIGGGKTTSVKKEELSNNPEPNIKDVEKKYGLQKTKYDDGPGGYAHYTSKKLGVDVTFWHDEHEPSAKEIDEVLDNYSKADKKAIFEDCKKYCYDLASKYWPDDVESKDDFYKKFDEDYEISSLYLLKDSPTVELNIDMKPHVWSSVMGDHELTTDYDKDFKKRASYGWATNG